MTAAESVLMIELFLVLKVAQKLTYTERERVREEETPDVSVKKFNQSASTVEAISAVQ